MVGSHHTQVTGRHHRLNSAELVATGPRAMVGCSWFAKGPQSLAELVISMWTRLYCRYIMICPWLDRFSWWATSYVARMLKYPLNGFSTFEPLLLNRPGIASDLVHPGTITSEADFPIFQNWAETHWNEPPKKETYQHFCWKILDRHKKWIQQNMSILSFLDHLRSSFLDPAGPCLIWGAIEAQPATSFAALGALGGVWHWNQGSLEISSGNQSLGLNSVAPLRKRTLKFPLYFCSDYVSQYFKVLSVWSCHAELPLTRFVPTIFWEIYPSTHISSKYQYTCQYHPFNSLFLRVISSKRHEQPAGWDLSPVSERGRVGVVTGGHRWSILTSPWSVWVLERIITPCYRIILKMVDFGSVVVQLGTLQVKFEWRGLIWFLFKPTSSTARIIAIKLPLWALQLILPCNRPPHLFMSPIQLNTPFISMKTNAEPHQLFKILWLVVWNIFYCSILLGILIPTDFHEMSVAMCDRWSALGFLREHLGAYTC